MNERLSYAIGEVPPFAYCESSSATSNGPWHLRRITPDVGLKCGGGIDSDGLCGRPKAALGGWDLRVRISPENLAHACPVCKQRYDAALAEVAEVPAAMATEVGMRRNAGRAVTWGGPRYPKSGIIGGYVAAFTPVSAVVRHLELSPRCHFEEDRSHNDRYLVESAKKPGKWYAPLASVIDKSLAAADGKGTESGEGGGS